MKMKPGQAEGWGNTRQMGRSRYIWRYGVLGWGLSVGLVWPLAMAAIQGWERLPILFPLSLIVFPIAGYFYGVWTWRMFEARYEQASRERTDT